MDHLVEKHDAMGLLPGGVWKAGRVTLLTHNRQAFRISYIICFKCSVQFQVLLNRKLPSVQFIMVSSFYSPREEKVYPNRCLLVGRWVEELMK